MKQNSIRPDWAADRERWFEIIQNINPPRKRRKGEVRKSWNSRLGPNWSGAHAIQFATGPALLRSGTGFRSQHFDCQLFFGMSLSQASVFAHSSLILNYCHNKLAKPNRYCLIPTERGTFLFSNCIKYHSM